MSENSLHSIIPEILDDNSGGIKFLDLLVIITEMHSKEPIKEFRCVDDVGIAQSLMDMLEQIDMVHILPYHWKSMGRDKFFIYQKK